MNIKASDANELLCDNTVINNDKHLKKLEITSDLGFFTVRDLEDHLTQHHHMHPSFAAVLIVPPDKSMVLCFNQTSICLFESLTHGLQGGIIATSSSENVSHFVKYLERMVMQDWKNGLHGSKHSSLKAEINFEKGLIRH